MRFGIVLSTCLAVGLLIGCERQIPSPNVGTYTLVTSGGPTTLPATATSPAGRDVWLLSPELSLPITEPRLDNRLRSFDLDRLPLDQALDRLGREAGINLRVEWRSLEAAGIDRHMPISLRLHDLPAGRVLDSILRNAENAPTAALAFWVNGGVVTIGLSEKEPAVTAVYDINDRLRYLKAHADQVAADFPPRPFEPWIISDRIGNVCWPSTNRLYTTSTREDYADKLTALIRDRVEPGTWRYDGGTTGDIRELDGFLIVTHTPRVQRQIRSLLSMFDR